MLGAGGIQNARKCVNFFSERLLLMSEQYRRPPFCIVDLGRPEDIC